MPSKFTEHYNLNQWSASDRVHHDDFNADNLKLDAALHTLDTSLSKLDTSLTTSLAGKVGSSQIIRSTKSSGQTSGGFAYTFPKITWSDWEYVCVLVHYPGTSTESTPLVFSVLDEKLKECAAAPLALPGYLVLFLPWHDGTRPAAGFVISSRLIPFSATFSFDAMQRFSCETQNLAYTLVNPNVVLFGGK